MLHLHTIKKGTVKRVTIKDIAKHLGISVSTVSRALANDKNIRQETKEKIYAAAEQLNYRRNTYAANLRSGNASFIGFIADEMTSPAAALILAGVQKVMQRQGISVLVACSYNNPQQEAENLRAMEEQLVGGMIIIPCHESRSAIIMNEMQAKGMPMVFCMRSLREIEAPQVVVNDYNKAFFLLDYIARDGRKQIVLLKAPNSSKQGSEIHRAYLDVLRKFKLVAAPELTVECAPTPEAGAAAIDSLIERGIQFDSVFASSDLSAIGAMNRLLERKVNVPEQVSVAGFAGSPLAQIVYPHLTTVEPALTDMGEKAADMLLEKIHNPTAENRTITIPASICLRGSSHPDKAEPAGRDDTDNPPE